MIKYVVLGYRRLKVILKRNVFKHFLKTEMLSQFLAVPHIYDKNDFNMWSKTIKRLKALLKRNVFKRFLKTEMLAQFLTFRGREFHNCGATCANDRSPKVLQLVFGMCSSP